MHIIQEKKMHERLTVSEKANHSLSFGHMRGGEHDGLEIKLL